MIAVLRIGTILMLLARGYEYIRWGGPFRDIFYHPQGFGGWFSSMVDVPMHELLKDPFYESLLGTISDLIGYLYVATALVILFFERFSKLLISVSSFFLLIHFFGLFYHKNLEQWGIVFEHAAQFFLPWCFIWLKEKKLRKAAWISVIAISITFFAHGLYALGYYPQPGHFVDMMISGFGITEDMARESLVHIAYLDFIFAGIVLFTPVLSETKVIRSILFINLLYGVVWGGLTALARVYTTYTAGMEWHWLDQYLFQTIVRVPHFLIPLFIIQFYGLSVFKMKSKTTSSRY